MERRAKDRLKQQQSNKASSGQDKARRKAFLSKSVVAVGMILVVVFVVVCLFVIGGKPERLMPELWEEGSGEVLLEEASFKTALTELKTKLQKKEDYLNFILENDFTGFKHNLIYWANNRINKGEIKKDITEMWAESKSRFQLFLEGHMEDIFQDVRASSLMAVDNMGQLIGADLEAVEQKGPGRSMLLLGEKQIAFYDLSSVEIENYIRRQIEELYQVIAQIDRTKQVGGERFAKIRRAIESLDKYFTFETRTRVDLSEAEGLVSGVKEVYLAINYVRLYHDTYWDERLTGIPQERLIAELKEFYKRREESGISDEIRLSIPLSQGGEVEIYPYFETTVTLRGPLSVLKFTNNPLVL